MPVDSPKDIERQEGTDKSGASTLYSFLLTCLIVIVVLIFVNHFFNVAPTPQPPNPVSLVPVPVPEAQPAASAP